MNLPYGYLGEQGIEVKYVGHTERDFGLVNGKEYVVFSHSEGNRSQGHSRFSSSGVLTYPDMLNVRVSDPDDRFGGVISYPADQFEVIERVPA